MSSAERLGRSNRADGSRETRQMFKSSSPSAIRDRVLESGRECERHRYIRGLDPDRLIDSATRAAVGEGCGFESGITASCVSRRRRLASLQRSSFGPSVKYAIDRLLPGDIVMLAKAWLGLFDRGGKDGVVVGDGITV
jgi:hypothetical protein